MLIWKLLISAWVLSVTNRFLVYSRFCLSRFLVYSRFCLSRFLVYSRFCLSRFQVYSRFWLLISAWVLSVTNKTLDALNYFCIVYPKFTKGYTLDYIHSTWNRTAFINVERWSPHINNCFKWKLSEPNLLVNNLCVRNRQTFDSYRLH
jgi:hypothetical protein